MHRGRDRQSCQPAVTTEKVRFRVSGGEQPALSGVGREEVPWELGFRDGWEFARWR